MIAIRHVSVLLVMAALVTACAGPSTQSDSLRGVWILSSLNGKALVPGTEITLIVRDGEFTGAGGCNQFGGKYTAIGAELHIPQVQSSAMACPTPAGVMGKEGAYYKALTNAAHYRPEGKRLTISNAAGDTVLVFSGR